MHHFSVLVKRLCGLGVYGYGTPGCVLPANWSCYPRIFMVGCSIFLFAPVGSHRFPVETRRLSRPGISKLQLEGQIRLRPVFINTALLAHHHMHLFT